MSVILLVDNGSRRAAATLQLRQLAAAVTERTGQTVYPVSLQHADGIDPQALSGVPAQIFYPFLAQQLASGEQEFTIVPLFFGMSRALTSLIPQQLAELKKKYGEFEYRITDVVYPLPQGEPHLPQIFEDLVRATVRENRIPLQHVVLVDHGSPIPEVTAVRKQLAQVLQARLGDGVRLYQAVMERRAAKKYDFNGMLLEGLLENLVDSGVTQVIVAMMFFLPGRHAGAGGDIESICEQVQGSYPDIDIKITPLLSEHPALADILFKRIAG